MDPSKIFKQKESASSQPSTSSLPPPPASRVTAPFVAHRSSPTGAHTGVSTAPPVSTTPLPFSFRALGGATDDLVSEVMPQFDAMRAEIENDPMFRGLHRVMAMLGGDVPFSRSSQPLPFSMTRGGARDRFGGETQRGESKGGSRDIPIIDASPASLSPDRSAAPPSRENGMRNSALPHPRDLSEDARVQGPIDSIRNSLDRWTNKLSSIVNGTHAPTSQKPRSSADNRSREDTPESDDSQD